MQTWLPGPTLSILLFTFLIATPATQAQIQSLRERNASWEAGPVTGLPGDGRIGGEVDQTGFEDAGGHGHDDGVRVVIDPGAVDRDGFDAAGIDGDDGSVEKDVTGHHVVEIQLVECVEVSCRSETVDRG